MPINDIVNVTITRATGGVQKKGFGTPLILNPGGTRFANNEFVRSYGDLDSVLADFVSSHPVAQAATRLFAAENKPKTIKVGELPSTMAAFIVSDAYELNAYDEFTVQFQYTEGPLEASYTVQEGDDKDDIVEGLASAVTALGETCPYAATTVSSPQLGRKLLVLTIKEGATVEKVCALSEDAELLQSFMYNGTFADDMVKLRKQDDDWYLFGVTTRNVAAQKGVADWAETQKKLFACASNDPRIRALDAVQEGDGMNLAEYIQDKGYVRTFAFYHSYATYMTTAFSVHYDTTLELIPNVKEYAPGGPSSDEPTLAQIFEYIGDARNDQWADFGIIASCIYVDPDIETLTWKFKSIVGVSADTFSSTEWARVKSFNCNLYNEVGGEDIFEEGQVGEGEYIDIITGIDWLYFRLQEQVYALLRRNLKVPYTDDGIGMIVGVVASVLQWGQRTSFLAFDNSLGPQGYRIEYLKRAEQDLNDRASRLVKGITFTATVAGAIHAVQIHGTVSI